MSLGHKANVTSVTVLTEWEGEVSTISKTFHWVSEAMTHICFSVSPSRSVQRVALLKQSLWRHMLRDQLGRSTENGIKRQSINCRASNAEKLSALSLCSFLSVLILSSKTFGYQSIPSLSFYRVTHLSGSMRMELMELYVLSCSHASRGL